ncbi:MAG: transglycosylase SLT domain-containing protein [Desulfomonile tiedjei]|nr:transglycosylase SLT domain-containing protein [Desulfomonile tiedjei]
MSPLRRIEGVAAIFLRRRGAFAGLLMLAASALALSGCGSTASMVKQNLEYKPIVCNAFSRALALGSDQKKNSPTSPTKPTSFPPLPIDERTDRVRHFVREYAYRQRETMRHYLARAEKYLPVVKATVREHGLPEDIAYLVMLESGANPEARSPANALGMWQFMPATARSYGLKVDSWVDERLDPEKSTKAAMLYLKDLYGMFGCWRLALSAYNSGENKLNKVLCQEDANEYDEICTSRSLKRETREFFPRFQAMAHIAKNPEKYGFPTRSEKVQEAKHEFATIEGNYSLDSLAKAMALTQEKLVQMNPALIRGQTPSNGSPYPLRVPLGKKEVLSAQLERIPVESREAHIVHVVHSKENVFQLCKRYQTDKSQLAALNPDINFRRRLRPGSKIVVPAPKIQTKKSLRNDRLSLLK